MFTIVIENVDGYSAYGVAEVLKNIAEDMGDVSSGVSEGEAGRIYDENGTHIASWEWTTSTD